MPLKKKLKDVGYTRSFMPIPPQHGGDWKQWLLNSNQGSAMMKKKPKKSKR